MSGASAKLTLRGVTVSGNRLTGTAAVGAGAIAAGSGATLVLERFVLRDNRSEAASEQRGRRRDRRRRRVGDDHRLGGRGQRVRRDHFARGGGRGLVGQRGQRRSWCRAVRSRATSVDPATGTNSSAVGGLELNLGTSLSITDSTVSENSVSAAGATGFRTGGIDTSSVTDVTLTNVTVTDNVAAAGGGFTADGISLFAGTKTVRNSIVAGGGPVNCLTSGSAISSSGGNIEDANSCNFTGPGDLVNTDPQLGALSINGGLGLTSAPLISSPALGLARPGFCSATDQTGVARPQGGGCDSGAVESATPPVNTTPPSISGTAAAGETLTCNPGAFTQNPTIAFRWLSDGAAIAGATATAFTVTDAQLDTAVQCQVTATNFAGADRGDVSGRQPAAAACQSSPSPPVNTARPSFTGMLRTGKELTCAPGTFTGATSFAFAWLRNGRRIAGATAATYTLTKRDAGKAIQCRVTATGAGGTVVADSAPACRHTRASCRSWSARPSRPRPRSSRRRIARLARRRSASRTRNRDRAVSSPAKGRTAAPARTSRSPSRSSGAS